MKNHIETVSPIIKLDDTEQSEQEEIHAQKEQLKTAHAAADDDSRSPAENVAEQDKIAAQINILDRQLAMYAGRSKKRLPLLLDAIKGMKEDHRNAENKHIDERRQLAVDTIANKSAEIEAFKNLLMAIAWLRDSSDDNLPDALKNLIDGAGYFDRHEPSVAAKEIGVYLESPQQPDELTQAEDILMRELGTDWSIQSSDWVETRIYNQTPDMGVQTDSSVVEEHAGDYEQRQGAQYLDLSETA